MATYINNLRLKEIATGDESGTWGTSTNTNLELIGEALGFGTEAITTNADTHDTIIADGSTDPGRAMYLKYTGTLDSACTITISPNTVKRLQFIENGTSGSQNIIISQGSGANITIPPGDTKVVYLDGAGSGAAVVDAFASLNVVDLKVQDDLTVTDDLVVNGDIDLEGSIDVNGTANLDVVDIDGAVDMASTLQVDGAITSSSTINGVGIKFNVTNFSNSLLISNDAGTGTLSTASNNTGLGNDVFNVLTSGDQNTGVGAEAMDALTEGSNNTAVGYEALGKLTTGTDNVGVGRAAGLDNTNGTGNTSIGVEALENQNGGNNNVGVGKQAGRSVTSGGNNMLLGVSAGNSGSPGGAITSGNNEVTLGNGDHSKINAQVSITVASDERDKTDFQALNAGLDFVNGLTPYTFYWDKRHKYVDWDSNPDTDLNSVTHDGTHKEDWLDLGFKAQDVVALEESINHKISNKTNLVSNLSGDGKQYALQYEKFVPILVKALQEADDKIDALTARVAALES